MSCKLIKKDLESILYDDLVKYFGEESAAKIAVRFESDTFLKDFGNYIELMENKSEFIPKEFNGRLNEKFEPKLFEDEIGIYYLDGQYSKQYLDTKTELFSILQSERAINSLTQILGNNYIEEGGFGLDFDTLDMSDNNSKTSLRNSIMMKLASLGEELIESDNVTLATNGAVLFDIVDNEKALDELVSKIKDFYKSRQIIYTEDYSREDVDVETEEQRDPIFNQASFKVNPRNKVTAMIKIRLSMIKNPTDLDEDFGQPKSIDYGSLYNKMTALLKDNPVTIDNDGNVENVFETIIDILKSHSNNIKYLSNVAEYLEKINRIPIDLSTKQGINTFKFIAGFVNVMNLQKNILEYSEVSYKEVILEPAITEERVLPNGAIKKVVIKEAIMGKEYIYDRRDATKDTKVEKNILTNWGLLIVDFFEMESKEGVFNMNKESFTKIKNRVRDIFNDKNISNQEKANIVFNKVLPHLGLNINEASFNFAMNELKDYKIDEAKLNQNYYHFVENTVKTLDSLLTNFTEKKDILNTYWYRQLAKAEAFYREDGSESSVFTAGETRYIYSNPSYLHNTTNGWKKNRQLLLDEYNNQSSFEKGSALYEYLLAFDIENNEELQLSTSKERIENFKVNHFSSFRDKSNLKSKQKTNKDISKNEYIQDTINGLLHYHIDGVTHTRTTTAPGKSTQYNLEHGMFIDSGFNIYNNIKDIDTTVNLLFDKYLMAEFSRMQEQYEIVKSNKNLKVYYHTNKKFEVFSKDKLAGNAFKSQLFPSLSFDKIDSVIRIDSQTPLYREDGSIIFENIQFYKQDILNFIEEKVLDHIEDLKSDLIKYNIIERSGENTYTNKGIDGRIITNVKYTNGAYNFTEESLFRFMGDLWLNGLVNHIEYSKLFSGDVAYYKDSVDYIKRIGASYTDGIYEYLSDINKDFNIGIVESVEYVEPYLNELKEVIKSDERLVQEWENTVNAADAQAWITLKRWKSILLGVDKYTDKHEVVYQKLTGKSNESLTTDELKLVAQPLKGVYFGKDKLGSPIYLKYSQAVLLPQILSNSKLQDLHDFMNHHKLDELLTFDAIKAGSVIPTKIHTEDGKVDVRNEDGSFKSLNRMTINSKGWKLQQDLPTKTFKQTDIGSQILKNMLLLIADKFKSGEKTFEHNGVQYTPEEFAKELDSTLGSLVAEGYNDLVEEFDISEDGVIKNVDKFYNTLANEIIDRDGSNEIAKALKAKLSIYAVPGLKNKLDNIFASIVNDRTVKIKTNGGSFIQMSNFGLSKEEADIKHKNIKWSPALEQGASTRPYTYKLNPDGTRAKNIFGEDIIKPEQILISGSFIAKYIPNYEKFTSEKLFGKVNPETGELEGGMIDNKILSNIIGYRIPNQGPSSNGALEVVGILPAGMGDTIVAFAGITKKTGSDKISLFDLV